MLYSLFRANSPELSEEVEYHRSVLRIRFEKRKRDSNMYNHFYTETAVYNDMKELLNKLDSDGVVTGWGENDEAYTVGECVSELAKSLEENERPLFCFAGKDIDPIGNVQNSWRAFLITNHRLLIAFAKECKGGIISEFKGTESFNFRAVSQMECDIEKNEFTMEISGWEYGQGTEYHIRFNKKNAASKVKEHINLAVDSLPLDSPMIRPNGATEKNPPCRRRVLDTDRETPAMVAAKCGGGIILEDTSAAESEDMHLGDVRFVKMDLSEKRRPSYTAKCCVREAPDSPIDEIALRNALQKVVAFKMVCAKYVAVPNDFPASPKEGKSNEWNAIVAECLHPLTRTPQGAIRYTH